jgi:hypothetical protein
MGKIWTILNLFNGNTIAVRFNEESRFEVFCASPDFHGGLNYIQIFGGGVRRKLQFYKAFPSLDLSQTLQIF